MSDIFATDEGWYYYTLDDDIEGPFATYEQAQTAYDASVKWHVREHKDDIRKMRDYMGR